MNKNPIFFAKKNQYKRHINQTKLAEIPKNFLVKIQNWNVSL